MAFCVLVGGTFSEDGEVVALCGLFCVAGLVEFVICDVLEQQTPM